jgi:hypothetical protein
VLRAVMPDERTRKLLAMKRDEPCLLMIPPHLDRRADLADRSAAAHADEQSRSRRRRESRRAGGLRRHRPRRARLGMLRPHRRDAEARLEDDETLLVQSGKPVGVFRTHADAPRVLIANSNLVPHWATWEHFNELDRKGLMMYGQMTAGSWIYIGSQGIVQGTYETFVEMGRQHFGGNLAGKWILTAGSAAWAARSRWPRPWPAPACWPSNASQSRIEMRLRPAISTCRRSARRGAGHDRAQAKPKKAGLGRPARQRAMCCPNCSSAASGPTR